MRGAFSQLLIERAEGAYLYSSDGRRILDAGAGAVVVNIGQGRAELAELAAEVMGRLNYVVPIWGSPERLRLIERLSGWTPPGLSRFFFTSGGSEAIEAALKFAIMYHKLQGRPAKRKIVSRHLSYHGNTLGALSAASNRRRADYEHVLIDWPKIPPSYCYRCPWGKRYPGCDIDCAQALEETVRCHGADAIAAFMAEPMVGSSGGVIPPVAEYWPRIAEICRRNDILLIADEVMTGFGRTGSRFAVDHWNVRPDILVGGKGLTGGYLPMGMIAVDERLVDQCEAAGGDFMFYTYSSHPLACAISERVLAIMERERLVERSAEMGARLGARLKEQLSGHPLVGDIRGTAMFWGVEVVAERNSGRPFDREIGMTRRIVDAALRRGLFVYPATGMAREWGGGDAVMITPPLVIGQDEIEFIANVLGEALDEAQASL